MFRGPLLCAILALCTAAGAAEPLDVGPGNETVAEVDREVMPEVEAEQLSPAGPDAAAATAGDEPVPSVDAGAPAGADDPLADDPLLEEEDLLAEDPLLDDDLDSETGGVQDPFEGVNRKIFVFNQALDDYGWGPLTAVYQFVMPEPMRRGIHRMFHNVGTPVLFVNQMFQLRIGDGGRTLGRFVLNTTVGLFGFFDPGAEGAGWERQPGDFGQTMATYGVESGPYLMIPIFGPNTVRDAAGGLFDFALDPMLYIVGPLEWFVLLGTSEGLAQREANADALDALETSSVDFYAALRSAYLQARAAELSGSGAKSDNYVLMR